MDARSQSYRPARGLLLCLATAMAFTSLSVLATERDQARRIHDRLTGVPPTEATLNAMAADIRSGNALRAAFTAMEDDGFYNVTLKNFAAPWTNEAMSPFVPLNDYSATVIGAVRDNLDFRRILWDDLVYVGSGNLGLPAWSTSNNRHYEQLESGGHSLQDHLVRRSQSALNGLPSDATAGVMTSRAASQAFFSAGTNRAMLRFTLMNHLCSDLEQVADVTLPVDRIRQDVSRSPGGDSRVFLNNCAGCHTGMDPMAQAFAYYDFQYDADTDPDGLLGRLIYNTTEHPETGTRVQPKYLINASNFEPGYVTEDDQWDNYWRRGDNRRLGWDNTLPGTGQGAKSLGQELAHSEAFAQCQVQKVFRQVCLRDPANARDRNQLESLVSSFRSRSYNLRQVFAESAVYCMGD